MKTQEFCPEPDCKILFAAATAYAERIKKKERKIQISKAHRGYMATLDNGWIIIDQKWYS